MNRSHISYTRTQFSSGGTTLCISAIHASGRTASLSIHCTQQLRLQDELPLLVLLASLISLVVLPTHGIVALLALDVTHNVSSRRHVALHRLGLLDVDDGREQKRLTVLPSEIPRDDVVEVCEVSFAVLGRRRLVVSLIEVKRRRCG